VAKTVNGFWGGISGCAMSGQSMINVQSGGGTRIAGGGGTVPVGFHPGCHPSYLNRTRWPRWLM